MSADPYEIPSSHRPLVERGTYIPAWYREHKDLTLRVVDQNGGDLGFTIADVLPERRWAIDSQGRLLGSQEFENRYRDWISRVTVRDGRIISMGAVNKYWDVTLETVPPPDEFVDAKLDPMRPGELRYVPIKSKAHLDKHTRTKIRPIYNVMGEKVVAGQEQPRPLEGFTPAPVPQEIAKEAMIVAPCGREVKEKRLNQHRSVCKSCKAGIVETPAA